MTLTPPPATCHRMYPAPLDGDSLMDRMLELVLAEVTHSHKNCINSIVEEMSNEALKLSNNQ